MVAHVLWMYDLAGPDTEWKTRDQVIRMLYGNYLTNCTGRQYGIEYAVSTWVTSNTTIAAQKYDAVVFMIGDIKASLVKKLGGSIERARNNQKHLGTTLLGATGGGLAEIYWDRCFNSFEVAAAIFHEAAHLKSGQDDTMHDAAGVRVLSAAGGQFQYPSWEDLEFYQAAIKRPITVRTKVPIF